MRSLKGVDHPNVWKLLSDIKEEDMLARLDILNTGNGNPPVKRVRQIYLDLQRRLRNLCEERAAGARNLDDFLRAVGRNPIPNPSNGELKYNSTVVSSAMEQMTLAFISR